MLPHGTEALGSVQNTAGGLDTVGSVHVFLSWSGPESRAVAAKLSSWLPKLMNAVKPFMSQEDISAGARWSGEIAAALDSAAVGIVCVTRGNQKAPWLNFEAGAIAKRVGDVTCLIPLAIDLSATDVATPLGQFQAKEATQSGLWDVVLAVNAALPESVGEDQLRDVFELVWPEMDEAIALARNNQTPQTPAQRRTDRELLEDVLSTVRQLASVDVAGLAARGRTQGVPRSRRRLMAERVLEDAARSALGPDHDWWVHTTGDGRLHLHVGHSVPEVAADLIRQAMEEIRVPYELIHRGDPRLDLPRRARAWRPSDPADR